LFGGIERSADRGYRRRRAFVSQDPDDHVVIGEIDRAADDGLVARTGDVYAGFWRPESTVPHGFK